MANREIYPGGAYPLEGDVTSTPGSPNVTVTGLQNVPLSSAVLNGGETLTYSGNTNTWSPTLMYEILVNGTVVSFDPFMSVNVTKPIFVNGV